MCDVYIKYQLDFINKDSINSDLLDLKLCLWIKRCKQVWTGLQKNSIKMCLLAICELLMLLNLSILLMNSNGRNARDNFEFMNVSLCKQNVKVLYSPMEKKVARKELYTAILL